MLQYIQHYCIFNFMMNPYIPKKFRPRLDHVGIAVDNLESASEIYSNLGLTHGNTETLTNHGVEIVFFQAGEIQIELLSPLHDGSPVAKFLKRRGPGLHHIAFSVVDIHKALDHCISRGFKPIDAEPRPGADGCLIAFLHPKSTCGILIELCEKRKDK